MSAANLATNATGRPGFQSTSSSDLRVNLAIPVAEVAAWRRDAFAKIAQVASLPVDWDSQQSPPPGRAVRQTAIELLQRVPGDEYPAPHIIPVSGGGLHLEWEVGDRELEISIEPDGAVEALRVEHGMPIDAEPEGSDVASLFRWLAQ